MTTWIKTDDRLPERNQTVVICIEHQYVNAPKVQSIQPAWFDGSQFREIGGGMYPNVYHRPSHWMALPQGPRDGA